MAFLFGLIIGSFLNVLVWRLNDPKAPKFWQGRSLCPECRHQIAWFDNLPLLSYFLLKGRCRHCRRSINWQYPAAELLTAAFFALAWSLTSGQPVLYFLGILGVGSCFIVIFFSDLKYGFIPDEMVGAAAVFGLLLYSGHIRDLPWALLIGILSAFFFLIIYLLTLRRGLGFGDVKLALVMGLVLGLPKLVLALWFGFVVGGIVATILLILKKTKMSATIPLGPFLILGTGVSALWTNFLLRLIGL